MRISVLRREKTAKVILRCARETCLHFANLFLLRRITMTMANGYVIVTYRRN